MATHMVCQKADIKPKIRLSKSNIPEDLIHAGRSICGFPVGKPFVAMLDVNVEDLSSFRCQDLFILLPYDPCEDGIAMSGDHRPIETHDPPSKVADSQLVSSQNEPEKVSTINAGIEQGWIVIEKLDTGADAGWDERNSVEMTGAHTEENVLLSSPNQHKDHQKHIEDKDTVAEVSSFQDFEAQMVAGSSPSRRKSTPRRSKTKNTHKKLQKKPRCTIESLPYDLSTKSRNSTVSNVDLKNSTGAKSLPAGTTPSTLANNQSSVSKQSSTNLSKSRTLSVLAAQIKSRISSSAASVETCPPVSGQSNVAADTVSTSPGCQGEPGVSATTTQDNTLSQVNQPTNISAGLTTKDNSSKVTDNYEVLADTFPSDGIPSASTVPSVTSSFSKENGTEGGTVQHDGQVKGLCQNEGANMSLATLADAAVVVDQNSPVKQQQEGPPRRSGRKRKLPSQAQANPTAGNGLTHEMEEEEVVDRVKRAVSSGSPSRIKNRNKLTSQIKNKNNPISIKYVKKHRVKLEDHLDKFEIVKMEINPATLHRISKHHLFACRVCDVFQCGNEETFIQHLENHLSGKLNCVHCRFVASSNGDLMTHVSKEHPNNNVRGKNKFVCDLCQQTFHNLMTFRRHMGNKHDIHQFSCKYCDKRFPSEAARMNHCKLEHPKSVNLCNKCGKAFPRYSLSNMKQHVEKCTGKVTCDLCGKQLSSVRGSLHQHKRLAHEQVRRFPCPQCPFVGKTKETIHRHINAHDGIRHHVCELCGKAFGQRATLEKHQMTHKDSRVIVFECEQCPFITKWKTSFETHMSQHQNEIKIFKCDHCPFVTKIKKTFETHMSQHQNGNGMMASCLICKIHFKDNDQLNAHIEEVH